MVPLRLPLAGQPGAILVVHPDPRVRRSISETLPADWVVNFVRDAQTAHRVLSIDESIKAAHRFVRAQLFTRRNSDLVPALMRFWAKYMERFGTICACIMNGDRSLGAAAFPRDPSCWDGARVLMGSTARGATAYVVSETQFLELAPALESAISRADRKPQFGWDPAFPASLARELASCDRQRALSYELRQWGQDYVILSEPFGALVLFRDGEVRWFAFGDHLTEPVLPAGVDCTKEQSWRALADPEFGFSRWVVHCDGGPSPATSYDTWLARQPLRRAWI